MQGVSLQVQMNEPAISVGSEGGLATGHGHDHGRR
jgi:hypothetical protein